MPDLVVEHVDSMLVERIRALARDRQCTLNDVMLQALRHGVGLATNQMLQESWREPASVQSLDGHWDVAEQGAFAEALDALAQTSPTQLAPERIRAESGGAK